MEPVKTLRRSRSDAGIFGGFGGAAEGLRSRLSALDAQVGEMSAGWTGKAGGAYGSAWQLWHRGAGEVQLGLAFLAKAVRLAGMEFQQHDAASAAVLRGVDDG